MLMSMTGFGKSAANNGNIKITVEIKSLNSKQMDLNVRIPYSLRMGELPLRNELARSLERGKVDVVVSMEATGDASTATASRLNVDVMADYLAQMRNAAKILGVALPENMMGTLLRMPETMSAPTAAETDVETIAAVMEAAAGAIDALCEHRRAEGRELEKFFAARLDVIEDIMGEIAPFETERLERIRQRLQEGVTKIPAIEFDKGRLEQEMIFYIEKLDVAEEKQRLAKHLAYFRETMALPHPGQGKKLGFIAQEMGREINTLGSKSNHAAMQACVVRMKDALEQIKEQVLNVM